MLLAEANEGHCGAVPHEPEAAFVASVRAQDCLSMKRPSFASARNQKESTRPWLTNTTNPL